VAYHRHRLGARERGDPAVNRARRVPVQAVRKSGCSLCPAQPGQPCQAQPAGDHLSRWLAAYQAGHISRDELARIFSELVVLTRFQVVPELGAA